MVSLSEGIGPRVQEQIDEHPLQLHSRIPAVMHIAIHDVG
jgi:hypothetical protein